MEFRRGDSAIQRYQHLQQEEIAVKAYLILNPTSKSGKGKRRWDNIFNLLKKYDVDYKVGKSTYAGHSIVLAREAALSKKYDSIVAVGGDGTINEVLNGICSTRDEIDLLPALGIIYTGTSPDICKYHKIPLDMEKAVQLIKENNQVPIDVGEVEHYIKDKKETRFFLCSVNLGIGARVADGSNSGLRKKFGDFLGTLLSIISATLKYKRATLNCKIDGKDYQFTNTLNMTIGKNPHVASGYKVNVDIKHDDGKSYIFSVNNMNLFEILLNLPRVYTGTFHKHKKNTLMYFKEFECAYSDEAPEVEYDGDPQGHLPCKVKLLTNKLRLIK